jgi:hypothetical protein
MEQDLVTVTKVYNPAEAELVRAALETEGIRCVIGGEGQAGLAGVLTIDILVPEDSLARARKHLKQLRLEKKERKKERIAKRKAKEADKDSNAIMEKKPGSSSTDVTKPKKK